MAGYDPGRFEEVMDWPLRDLFLGFIEKKRERARHNYELEFLVWAILAPHQKRPAKAPKVPDLLRG